MKQAVKHAQSVTSQQVEPTTTARPVLPLLELYHPTTNHQWKASPLCPERPEDDPDKREGDKASNINVVFGCCSRTTQCHCSPQNHKPQVTGKNTYWSRTSSGGELFKNDFEHYSMRRYRINVHSINTTDTAEQMQQGKEGRIKGAAV